MFSNRPYQPYLIAIEGIFTSLGIWWHVVKVVSRMTPPGLLWHIVKQTPPGVWWHVVKVVSHMKRPGLLRNATTPYRVSVLKKRQSFWSPIDIVCNSLISVISSNHLPAYRMRTIYFSCCTSSRRSSGLAAFVYSLEHYWYMEILRYVVLKHQQLNTSLIKWEKESPVEHQDTFLFTRYGGFKCDVNKGNG
ncbi:hypothetical protein ACFE04_011431 [Oxalis oulophora]